MSSGAPSVSATQVRRALALRRSLLARAAARAAPPITLRRPMRRIYRSAAPMRLPEVRQFAPPARTTAQAFLFGTGDIERLRRISFSAYIFSRVSRIILRIRVSRRTGLTAPKKGALARPLLEWIVRLSL